MAEIAELLKSIGSALSTIFRHLIPGVLVVAAVAVSRPSWFGSVLIHITENQWLIVLGVLAVVIGNVWFVLHRYIIQQIVDGFFWLCNAQGGPQRKKGPYSNQIAEQVWQFFIDQTIPKDIRQHVRFRTSSLILIYITAEVAILASCITEQTSKITPIKCWLFFAGVGVFILAACQNYLIRQIEWRVVRGRT